MPRGSSTTALQKLIAPRGAKKLPPAAGRAMNWRPSTKWRGSAACATPIVPAIRPCVNRAEAASMLQPSTLKRIDSRPPPAAVRSSLSSADAPTSPHSRSVSTDW